MCYVQCECMALPQQPTYLNSLVLFARWAAPVSLFTSRSRSLSPLLHMDNVQVRRHQLNDLGSNEIAEVGEDIKEVVR